MKTKTKNKLGDAVKVLAKTSLPLIFFFSVALVPVIAYAASEGYHFGGSGIVTLGETSGSITISTEIVLDEEAVALDDGGQQLIIDHEGDLSLTIDNNEAILTLPIVLQIDQTIAGYVEPDSEESDSEIRIEKDATTGNTVFRYILEDVEGEDSLVVQGEVLTDVIRYGFATEVIAENVTLSCAQKVETAAMAQEDEELGTVAACWSVELVSLEDDANVTSTVLRDTVEEVEQQLIVAASTEGRLIEEMAYVLQVEKTNLENGTNLGAATITMEVGHRWVEQWGVENIWVIRYGEEGTSQLLPTSYVSSYQKERFDEDSGQTVTDRIDVFEASSEIGLSTFALTALRDIPAPAWRLYLPIIGGSVTVMIATILIIVFRRRRKEKRLTSQWPTGLERDDWKQLD